MKSTETIQLVEYLRAVRRRWRLVALIAALTTTAALVVSLSGEKQYEASAELLLRGEEPINSILDTGGGFNSSDPERDLNTQVELIKVGGTAHAVRRALGIDRSTDALLGQIETEVSTTSNIVTITALDPAPVLAARIANAFAEAYVRFRVRSARDRYQAAAQLAERQLASLSEVERDSPQGRELLSKQRDLEIAASLQTGGAQIVRRASVPQSASRPRPKLAGGLGLVLGLLLGAGAALVRELLDRRIKDESVAEEFFDLPVLASIPRLARRGGPDADHMQLEAYGLLAANLRYSTLVGEAKVLMITSPGPAEGKTTATLGIAAAMARLGLRVIAIEADLRRPKFTEYTGIAAGGGLSDVISGTRQLNEELTWLDADTLAPTPSEGAQDTPSFAVLPAGMLPANPQRTLAAPRMASVIHIARALADIVLVDTAPVGTVNDAVSLVGSVDSIALVIRLEATTKDAGRRAMRVLRNLDVDVAGLIVTNAAAGERYGYYGAPSPVPEPGPVEVRGV